MIRTMNIEDYDKIYDLWIHTAGMGLNTTDDSRQGNRKKTCQFSAGSFRGRRDT